MRPSCGHGRSTTPLPDDVGPDSKLELAHPGVPQRHSTGLFDLCRSGLDLPGLCNTDRSFGCRLRRCALFLALDQWQIEPQDAQRRVIESAGSTNALVFFIILGATVFAVVFRFLGGEGVVKDILAASGIDTGWEVLIFLMVLVFFMGFFFDFIEISLIVIPIFYPIISRLNFGDHVEPPFAFMPWVTILIAVNLQTSFLTPPFGFSLFYMKGVVPPEVKMQSIYRGIIPFVILQLSAVALIMAFPEIALYMPRITGFLE